MTRFLWPVLIVLISWTTIEAQTRKLMGITNFGGASNTGTIFTLTSEGDQLTTQHNFGGFGPAVPLTTLTLGSDGKLYGTTNAGGEQNSGTLFSIEQSGSDFTIIHDFNQLTDGRTPYGQLFEQSNGRLYGTTFQGGDNEFGTIFSIEKDGSDFTVLHHFDGENGANSFSTITLGSDGKLYGTTARGGSEDEGVLYRMDLDGGNYEVLHQFAFSDEGGRPYCRPIEGDDGYLYGLVAEGGPNQGGGFYRIKLDGTDFSLLRSFSFDTSDSSTPLGNLLLASNGKFYSTSAGGGVEFKGTVFSINPDGSDFEVVYDFIGENGQLPLIGHTLLEIGGVLYGANFAGGSEGAGTLYRVNLDGSNFTKIIDFDDEVGGRPYAGMTEGNDGNLYGLTSSGGNFEVGTIYQIDPDLDLHSVIHIFNSSNEEGAQPVGRVTMATDNWAYGISRTGGDSGAGVIYRYDPFNDIFEHLFDMNETVGNYSTSELLQASNGWLYGMANRGGMENNGTIFRIMPGSNTLELLYEFSSLNNDGARPGGGFIEGSDGLLYGSTSSGGEFGLGSIFSFDPNTNAYNQLVSFDIESGYGITESLIEGSDGKLYGVNPFGGPFTLTSPRGTLFSVNKNGTDFNLIHEFDDLFEGFPNGSVTEASDGMLYGNIGNGTNLLNGSLYRIMKDGSDFEIFHEFDVVNGTTPQDKLLAYPNSDWIYGITRSGGSADEGVIFRFSTDDLAFEKIVDFEGYPTEGEEPIGGLLIFEEPSETSARPLLEGISIGPNPTSENFRFIFENDFPMQEDAKIRIYDETGKTAFQFNGNLILANSFLNSVTHTWDSGNYFIELEIDKKYFSETLVYLK